jgi:hypothetical protein
MEHKNFWFLLAIVAFIFAGILFNSTNSFILLIAFLIIGMYCLYQINN